MTTREFAARLTADNQALTDRTQVCKTPEEAYAIAKNEGVTDSFEVFTAEMTRIYESAKDLSDEDMENVAGGITDGELYAVTISVSGIGIMVGAALA